MKTILSTKKLLAGLALASSAVFSAGASAAVIGAWDWTSDGGFETNTATCNNGALQAACSLGFSNGGVTPSGIAGTSSVMTWGTASSQPNQSGLQAVFGASGSGPFNAALLGSGAVPIPAFGQIITNAGWSTTGAAVHYNNPITVAGGNMATSTLKTSFQLLTPIAGPVAEVSVGIMYNETTNNSNGSCPFGNPHGTVCDDIFSLSGGLTPVTFSVLGQLYKLSFQFLSGPGAIVLGDQIFTAESNPGTSTVFVQGRIDTINVPLPGVLTLMGLGFVMLGMQVRGRRRKLVA